MGPVVDSSPAATLWYVLSIEQHCMQQDHGGQQGAQKFAYGCAISAARQECCRSLLLFTTCRQGNAGPHTVQTPVKQAVWLLLDCVGTPPACITVIWLLCTLPPTHPERRSCTCQCFCYN
jgi:hypothetical protein